MMQPKTLLAKIPLGLQRYVLAVSSVAVALGISLFLYNNKFEGVEFPQQCNHRDGGPTVHPGGYCVSTLSCGSWLAVGKIGLIEQL